MDKKTTSPSRSLSGFDLKTSCPNTHLVRLELVSRVNVNLLIPSLKKQTCIITITKEINKMNKYMEVYMDILLVLYIYCIQGCN